MASSPDESDKEKVSHVRLGKVTVLAVIYLAQQQQKDTAIVVVAALANMMLSNLNLSHYYLYPLHMHSCALYSFLGDLIPVHLRLVDGLGSIWSDLYSRGKM